MYPTLQHAAMRSVDWAMACVPRAVPSQAALHGARVIAHRGEHDNKSVLENTLPAFDIARDNGVWGVECDLRWTADLVPVVTHDPCGTRLFSNPALISQLSQAQLRQQMPQIPTLAEVVAEFGVNTHLMLEIKAEHFPFPEQQKQILRAQLAPLLPGRDYHFLALDTALFKMVDFVPRQYCFGVSETNTGLLSQQLIDSGYGGLTGHFLLLNNKVQQRHQDAGQAIGTGFISSRNCLFRELNRGVKWVFSNHAVKIQRILEQYRRQGPGR